MSEWLSALHSEGYKISLRPRENMLARACEMSGFDDKWEDSSEPVIFLNGRVLHLPEINHDSSKKVVDNAGNVLWARVEGAKVSKLLSLSGTQLAEALVKQEDGGVCVEDLGGIAATFIWDYMASNEKLLQKGFGGAEEAVLGSPLLPFPPGVANVGEKPVYAGDQPNIFPSVVLDSSDGPIWFGKNVTVEPHCYIKGPIAFGDHGKVKAGSVLYGGSSFGPHCRVSGEISATIMQGYCNKQHAGFLGNSHLGEWVNLGADTTVSNLRNDYGPIKVKLNQKLVDSGKQFVGLLCGDHVKTGINTMFNTGSVVGVAANVYGGGFPPRFIRSFSWGGNDGFHVEPLDRTLDSARIAVKRRGREISKAEVELLTEHYSNIIKQEK